MLAPYLYLPTRYIHAVKNIYSYHLSLEGSIRYNGAVNTSHDILEGPVIDHLTIHKTAHHKYSSSLVEEAFFIYQMITT